MTPQEKLRRVRQAVIAAVPGIMDLTFGCQLMRWTKRDNHSSIYYVLTDAGQGRPDGIVWISSIPFGAITIDFSKDEIKNGGEFEIIGRKITIADVLLAMEKVTWYKDDCSKIGKFCLEKWDCKTDDLSRATPETVDFLYDVLCK